MRLKATPERDNNNHHNCTESVSGVISLILLLAGELLLTTLETSKDNIAVPYVSFDCMWLATLCHYRQRHIFINRLLVTPTEDRSAVQMKMQLQFYMAGPNGRAVEGVGLRPLACWECGFESHRRHGCLSVVSVVCCQVEVSATSWSLVQGNPTERGVSLFVI